jgi:excisionase family DNA binding protein
METEKHADLLTPPQVAARLNVKLQTLACWRMSGRHSLPFLKVGAAVRYRASDLDRWLAERSGTSCAAITHTLAAAGA